MNKKVTCTFIILGFNAPEITEQCLSRLQTYLGGKKEYRIVLFDNASTQSLSDVAKKHKVFYTRSEKNLGYAGGYNLAIAKNLDQSEILCLINPDVFIDSAFADEIDKALASFVSHPKLGLMQPILFKDQQYKKIENFGVAYYRSGLAFQNQQIPIPSGILANGACLFIKSDICRKLIKMFGQVFLSEFFMYAEDIELSVRLLRLGYGAWVNTNLRVIHLGSATTGRTSYRSLYYAWRNVQWVGYIHRSIRDLCFSIPNLLVGQVILVGLSLRHMYPLLLPKIWIDTLQHRKFLLQQRTQISGQADYLDFSSGGFLPRK